MNFKKSLTVAFFVFSGCECAAMSKLFNDGIAVVIKENTPCFYFYIQFDRKDKIDSFSDYQVSVAPIGESGEDIWSAEFRLAEISVPENIRSCIKYGKFPEGLAHNKTPTLFLNRPYRFMLSFHHQNFGVRFCLKKAEDGEIYASELGFHGICSSRPLRNGTPRSLWQSIRYYLED